MTRETSEPEAGDEPSYSFRASAIGGERVFRLSGQTLDWQVGLRSGRLNLDRITTVRLSYRPVTMQSHRFIAEIYSPDSPRLTLISTSWKSMFEQVRLDNDYRAFIGELHDRLAAGGAATRFKCGVHPAIFGATLLLFAGAGLGIVTLVVRSILADAWLAAFLIAAFLGLFLWHAGNFFYRNRSGRYQPDMLPRQLLPRGTR